ncbi:hypothetical protein Pan216_24470 [Planctomycetes bacterium Pan216]|uniref:Protein BatD n=1 Tax=Kolteria novifilia TaxID=2527975 RepID=A0A518B3T8_9BACT|nr:hypothetical protein Pan216_24470 [Planctomycetes bacterium Pan216]
MIATLLPMMLSPFIAVDVPLARRPSTYAGAIGQFQVEARLDPLAAPANAVRWLDIVIAGQGDFASAKSPDLTRQQRFDDAFAVVAAPTMTERPEKRTYRYPIRPRSPDVERVPPLAYSFFNPRSQRFETRYTRSIEFRNLPPRTVDAGDIVDYPLPAPPSMPAPPSVWGIYLRVGFAIGAVVVITFLVVKRRRRARAGEPTWAAGGSAAVEELRKELRQARERKDVEAESRVARLAVETMGDRLGCPPGTWTAREIASRLREHGCPEESIERVRLSLASWEKSRFGRPSDGITATAEELIERLEEIERHLEDGPAT